MFVNHPALVLLTLLAIGCTDNADPLAEADEKYTTIMVNLAKADRDSTRNIRNRDARKRKVEAENARTAFFKMRSVEDAFKKAAESDYPGTAQKLEAYQRHKLIAVSWTADEKKEETAVIETKNLEQDKKNADESIKDNGKETK